MKPSQNTAIAVYHISESSNGGITMYLDSARLRFSVIALTCLNVRLKIKTEHYWLLVGMRPIPMVNIVLQFSHLARDGFAALEDGLLLPTHEDLPCGCVAHLLNSSLWVIVVA
jgi:hypothetical protein